MCRLPHLWVGVLFCGLVDGWVFLLTFWYLTAYLKHLSPLQGYFYANNHSPNNFPCVSKFFPVSEPNSLCFPCLKKSKNQIPCLPCAVATLWCHWSITGHVGNPPAQTCSNLFNLDLAIQVLPLPQSPPQLDMSKIVQLELHHTGPPAQAMPSPPDMSKFVQIGSHLTGTTPTPNMFKLVNFVSRTVTKRAVGFQLKCLLVYLTRTLSRFHSHIFNQLSIITSPIGRHNFNDESSRTGWSWTWR